MTYPNIQPSLSDNVARAVGAAPTLTQYPDLLLSAAQSGNPEANAQVLDMIGQTSGTVQASQHLQQHHESLFHHLIGGVEHAAGAIWHVAAKGLDMTLAPLRDVQHAYRFQHELWTKSDPVSASLATLGVLGGAAAGAWLGGGLGAKLGADITGLGEEHLAETGALGGDFKQIAEHSANAKISPGRDLANLLGLHNTDSGWGKFVSGLGDATFDLNMDPVMAVGKLGKVARGSEHGLAELPVARRNVDVRNWLLEHGYGGLSTGSTKAADGTVLVDAVDRIAAAKNNPQYMRALNNMADAWTSGKFPTQFADRYGRLMPLLAANNVRTGEDIHNLFLAMANNGELLSNRYGMLPSQTILRGQANKAAAGLKGIGGTASGQETGLVRAVGRTLTGQRVETANGTVSPLTAAVAGKIRTFSGRAPFVIDKSTADGVTTLNLSSKKFDLMDPGALKEMYQSFRISMGDQAASLLVQDLAVHQAAGDLASLRLAWMNSHKQLLVAAGLPEDHALVQQVSRRVEDAHLKDEFYGTGESNYIDLTVPGRVDDAGQQVSIKVPAALWNHQATSQAAFPNFWEIKNSLRAMSKAGNLGGSLDEAVAAHYTNNIFKPLALVNAGFGFRVAMAEAIPASFRYGALNMLQGKLIAIHSKSDYKINMRAEKRLLADADAARETGDFDTMTSKTKALQDTVVGHKLAAMSKLAGGTAKLLGASDADFELAARLVEAGKGEIVWGAPRAGTHTHLEHANATDKATSRLWFGGQKSQGVRKGDGYTLFQPGQSGYAGEWHTQLTRLSEEQSARNIARDLHELHMNGLPEEIVTPAREGAAESPVTPAAKGLSPLFHGTSKEFEGDRPSPRYMRDSGSRNLFGFGFYTTSDSKVARSYTAKGGGANKKVYQVHWTGEGSPKLMDLQAPAPDALRRAITDSGVLHESFDTSVEADAQLREVLADPNAPGWKVWDAFRNVLSDAEITRAHADELYQDLSEHLTESGFDGFTHLGGVATGSDPHDVTIFFDPEKVKLTPHVVGQEPVPAVIRPAKTLTPDEAAIEAAKREAARIIDPEQYTNERNRIVRYQHQDPHAFAAARVDTVRSLLSGADGTFHAPLAKAVAKGQFIDPKALEKIPVTSAPRDVPGLELLPLPPTGLYSELVNRGFKRVVDPIINHLSREPLWFQAVKEQYSPLQHLVDKGLLSADDALDHAMYRATESVLPQIHNVMLRSQFALMARNLLPFYFAQEQALKRTAHLLTKSPDALNKYLLANQALKDPNFIEEVDGKKSLVIPWAGPLTGKILDVQALMGMNVQSALPVTFTGNTQSLQTVLPELTPPGVSPLLSVALNDLAKHFPEWSPEVEKVLGRGAGQSAKWSLIPNQLIRNTLIAQTKDMTDRTFANAVTQSITAAAARGDVPGPNATAFERQAFIDRMKNNARTLVMMKAVVGFASPLSPSVTAEDFGFRDEFNKMLDSGKTYSEAVNAFLAKHGTKYVSYTVAKTENTTGAYLPSTDEALKWMQLNEPLVKNHISAAYFIPENGHKSADGFAMYNEALNMSLRSQLTPDEFLTNMYIKSGMQTYMADKAAQDEFLSTLTDPEQIKQAQANWTAHVNDLKLSNVIWADDFTSDAKNLRAQAIYADMRHLFDSGQAPASPQAPLIQDLMRDYETHAAARAIAPVKKYEDDAWDTYLDGYVKMHPEMQSVVTNVFRRIDRRV